MAAAEKSRRPYHSPRREEQAAATRPSGSWRRLACSSSAYGYAATTMEAIAAEAGVALKTAYLPFATRERSAPSALGSAAAGRRRRGTRRAARPVPGGLDEPDPIRALQLNARDSRAAKTRIGDLFRVIRGAAEVDAECNALWALIQSDFHANQRRGCRVTAQERCSPSSPHRRTRRGTCSGRSTIPTCGCSSPADEDGRPAPTNAGLPTPAARSCSEPRPPEHLEKEPALQPRSADVDAADRAGDHQALDLGGAFEDRVAPPSPSGRIRESAVVRVSVPLVPADPCRFDAL